MTGEAISLLFARLVAASEAADSWARVDFGFDGSAGGLPCEVRLRAAVLARQGSGRLVGDIDVWLANAGGARELGAFAGLRFGVAMGEFADLSALYTATFSAAEAQLVADEAFQSAAERFAFEATLPRVGVATLAGSALRV
jgi:hypothetical protein